MRPLLFALAILAVGAGTGTRAQAQNYPWCAIYSGEAGGAQNCGFVSFQQCLEDVRGIGGFCMENNRYVPPGPAPPRRRHRQP